MTPDFPLPLPGSDELYAVVRSAELRRIYRFLFERRETPPTMVEIETHLAATTGDRHSQRGRRVRDLYPIFDIEKVGPARTPGYRLNGWNERAAVANTGQISSRVRAEVLSAAICVFCGHTPMKDRVRLVVDHKLPREWGGSNDRENLQPLCEECNGGKKNLFSSMEADDMDAVRHAAGFDEPHKRIGELLVASLGNFVPGDIIGAVASRGRFQEDWQKRTRELRVLGWDIRSRKRKVGSRFLTSYGCFHAEPWPAGNVAAEIRRRERERRDG